jgi:hypothetical protein
VSGQVATSAPERAPTTTVNVVIPPLAGLSDDDVEALQRIVVALGVHAGGGRPDVAEVLGILRSDTVADVLATEVVANALVTPTQLGAFVRLLRSEATERLAAVELLSARLAEWRGQAIMGERFVDAGLVLAPDSVPLLVDAAWCAADRGDAATAVELLDRAGAPADDPERSFLAGFAHGEPAATAAARNGLCPCGSGRRAKRCCRSNGRIPLERRAPWLYAKALAFARRPPQHRALVDAAAAVAGVEVSAAVVDRLALEASRPLAANLVLFEGGAMTDFAAERGSLLPPDEARLARRWSGCRHRLLVADGEGYLRDTRTGRATSDPVPGVRAGDAFVGVLVPLGGTGWAVLEGFQPVDPAAVPAQRPLDIGAITGAVRAAAAA